MSCFRSPLSARANFVCRPVAVESWVESWKSLGINVAIRREPSLSNPTGRILCWRARSPGTRLTASGSTSVLLRSTTGILSWKLSTVTSVSRATMPRLNNVSKRAVPCSSLAKLACSNCSFETKPASKRAWPTRCSKVAGSPSDHRRLRCVEQSTPDRRPNRIRSRERSDSVRRPQLQLEPSTDEPSRSPALSYNEECPLLHSSAVATNASPV